MTFNPGRNLPLLVRSLLHRGPGYWTYENGVLTLTDKNGKQYTGEGDPIKLHYTYSDSDQLTGDYTIPPLPLPLPQTEAAAPAARSSPLAPAAEPAVIPSDDGGTAMTFNPDGTYRFWFAAYSIEDLGAWTYENGVLTLTDKNGKTSVGEGDPIKLHYTYSDSNQLTGDYTIPATTFAALLQHRGRSTAAEARSEALMTEPAVIPSDDGGTEMTFNPDGTYRLLVRSLLHRGPGYLDL